METPRHVRATDSSRSFGTGIYGNSVVHYESTDNEPELSAEQVKAAYNAAVREDQAAQDKLETQKNADAFIEVHKEFIDNTANAHLLLNQMNTMFGEGLHTIEHFEQAYEYLRTKTNFLKLDAKEVEKQRSAAARQRYADARAVEANRITNLSEAELEALPLEEIRRLDAVERQKQMRRIAEEGGW